MTAAADNPRVIAVAGGKGGVGTSLLATNLAIHLARQGREVVLVDLSAGGADLHTYLGVKRPRRHLGEMLRDKTPELSDLLLASGTSNLRLLAGVPDRPRRAAPADDFPATTLENARQLRCDFVIADVGSGRTAEIRQACAAADTSLLVSTPEPSSARGVLSLQAAILFALMERALGPKNARLRCSTLENKGLRAVLQILKPDDDQRDSLLSTLQSHTFGLILNQVRTSAETETAARVGAVFSMMQATIIDPVMTLEYDHSAVQAVGERCVLAQRYPNAPLVRGLEKLAFCLLSPPPTPRPQPSRYLPLDEWHHYRLLALDPKASPREVQRHYERLKAPFVTDGDAEAVGSRRSLDRVMAQIENAYRTLIFLENRREYDAELVRAGVLSQADLRDHQPATMATEADVPDLPTSPAPALAAELAMTAESVHTADESPGREGLPGADGTEPSSESVINSDAVAGSADDESPAAVHHRASPSRATSASSEVTPVPLISDDDIAEGPPEKYSGSVLRSLRQKRRLGLDRIEAITKIRTQYIESIENEDYSELPVPVFLKGFVRAYARCLDLDAEMVVSDYMDGYGAWARDRT